MYMLGAVGTEVDEIVALYFKNLQFGVDVGRKNKLVITIK